MRFSSNSRRPKLPCLIKKIELLEKGNSNWKVYIIIKVNRRGQIVTSVRAPSPKLSSYVSRILIENFKFIPGKIKEENIGVGPWSFAVNF